MNEAKLHFLKSGLVPALEDIPSDRLPSWGKMTLQQMVEHFSDSVRIASGRTRHPEILTPESNLPRLREFILSDKPFRENSPNPLLPEIPAPVKNLSLQKALQELDGELRYFIEYFERHPQATTRNPFFGDLNFEQNIHFLYKHALHHLKQFGSTPEPLAS